MTTADIHALTGAYALDAVSGVERMEFERHLAECESCAQEVRELQETASRLALAATAPPPPALKARVMNEIKATRQAPPVTEPVPLRRRSLATRLSTVAAAVFFVAAAGLGVVVFQQGRQLEDREQAVQAEQILKADDAELVKVESRDGGTVNVAVSRSQGRMVLLSENLPDPPSGKTYQVWAIDGPETFRSMGFLEPSDGDAALAVSGLGDAASVGVSLEPEGGSPTPTDVLGAAELPA